MEVNFHFKSPEESPGFLLWQVNMLWQLELKKVLDPLDLTHTQFVVMAALAWLKKQQAIVSQNDIARHSKIDRMMTSKVLKILEKKTFIVRTASKIDTRSKEICLTADGAKTIQNALKIIEAADSKFFGKINVNTSTYQEMMMELLR
jgi:DNA-binding MarR family transcriptional regulator